MASPLEKFKTQHNERWTVLEDIPVWEWESVIRWLHKVYVRDGRTDFGHHVVRTIETEARLMFWDDLEVAPTSWSVMLESLSALWRARKYDKILILLDVTVHFLRDWEISPIMGEVWFDGNYYSLQRALGELELSLQNGSKWTVVFEQGSKDGLIERVSERITEVAKGLRNDHLTAAWNDAFAVKPSPAHAIENAQKAIEQVASASGLTKTTTKVYGSLLGDIKANPGKYVSAAKEAYDLTAKVANDPNDPLTSNERFSQWFWTGMDLIQKSNPARHQSEVTKGFVLKPEAGKQAVLLATLLCELISSGYFKRVS